VAGRAVPSVIAAKGGFARLAGAVIHIFVLFFLVLRDVIRTIPPMADGANNLHDPAASGIFAVVDHGRS
jgi:hypothetical protein